MGITRRLSLGRLCQKAPTARRVIRIDLIILFGYLEIDNIRSCHTVQLVPYPTATRSAVGMNDLELNHSD